MHVFAFNQKEHLQHGVINDLWGFWADTESFWGHLKLYYVLQNGAKPDLFKIEELLSIDWDITGASVLPGHVLVF